MTKICQICSVLPPWQDAVGNFTLKLNNLLKENGYETNIITSSNQEKIEDVFPLIDDWGLIGILKLIFFLRKNKIKIVVFQYPSALYKRKLAVTFFSFFSRFIKIKTITYLHEYSNYSWLGKIRISPLVIFSNTIITSDTVNEKLLKRRFDYFPKIYAISGGTNISNELIAEYYKKNKKEKNNELIKVLYFGLIRGGKGLLELLDAIETNHWMQQKFEFHFVGGVPSPTSKESSTILKKIKSLNFLKYHGFLEDEDLLNIFFDTDIVFLPFNDGVTERRSSFMTAMALAKLVVTTENKFPLEFLKDRENVYFIKKANLVEITNVFEDIQLLSKNEMKRIGENAKNWFENNYSDVKFINNFLDVIKPYEEN